MTYQQRLIKAMQQLFGPEWRGHVTSTDIQHDDWCRLFKGKACNCKPNIFIAAPDGLYSVSEHGRAKRVSNKKLTDSRE